MATRAFNRNRNPSQYKAKQVLLASKVCKEYGDPDGFEVRYIDESIGKKKRLERRPWSEAEKAVVFKYFENDILRNRLPGKRAIDECMRINPILKHRTWRNIKDCVRNRIASKKAKQLF